MAGDLFKKLGGVGEQLKEKAGEALDAAKEQAAGAVEELKVKAAELADGLQREKEIIAFPTYGYRRGGGWAIPARVWVNKARRAPVGDDVVSDDEAVAVLTRGAGHVSAEEVARLRERIRHFVADDDSKEEVRVRFDADPDGAADTTLGTTDPNGLVESELELAADRARRLLEAQGSASGWLTFTASSGEFEGKGRVRLVEPRGLSVVSDIDDTIKVTDIPAGKPTVIRNVFLRPYEVTPRMVERYQAFGDGVMFHYVSGSPWQLYKILGDFLVRDSGYPEGSFHMKSVRKNLLRLRESWEDFRNLADGSAGTLEQKEQQITEIFENLPERDFILVGDTGERDPDVFSIIRARFGARVRKIYIRDVVGERHTQPNRLGGMAVIDPEGNLVFDPDA